MAGEGVIRASLFRQQSGPSRNEDPVVKEALEKLAKYDNANAKVQAEGNKKELAAFHWDRIPLLRAVEKLITEPVEKLSFQRQIVDSIAAAYQTGFAAEGAKLLDGFKKEKGPIASYAAFRKISAEFALKNDEAGANLMANQKAWMTDLKGYLADYPNADEAKEALIQLASASEFNAEEDNARKYYVQLVKEFPTTEAGLKAAGALKRLNIVGKPIELKGPSLDGKVIDAAGYQGKTLLITFWASWAEPVRRDLPELLKLHQKYREKGFENPRGRPRFGPHRGRRFPQEQPLALASDFRARRHREEPLRDGIRHHRVADDDPRRPARQGREPQHPHLGGTRTPA